MMQILLPFARGLAFLAEMYIAPTSGEVREMSMALSPEGAPAIVVDAITRAVHDDAQFPLGGSYRSEAMLMLVYAREESGYDPHAVGDHGRSLGLFQLQRLTPEVAFDPRQNARIWLVRAHESYDRCAQNAEVSRLAAVVSGNCDHGRVLSAHRATLAEELFAGFDKKLADELALE